MLLSYARTTINYIFLNSFYKVAGTKSPHKSLKGIQRHFYSSLDKTSYMLLVHKPLSDGTSTVETSKNKTAKSEHHVTLGHNA